MTALETLKDLRRALELGDFQAAVALGFADSNARLFTRNFQASLTNQTRNAWDLGATGNVHLPSSAVACEIVSSSTADSSASTGARTVYVEGLNASFEIVSETATMNGQTPVALSNTYFRILRVEIVTAGSGTLNAGNISVRTVSGSNVMGYIIANAGRMGSLCYTVPAGRKVFLLEMGYDPSFADVSYTDASTAVSTEASQMILYRRLSTGPYHLEHRLSTRRVPAVRRFGFAMQFTAGQDIDISVQTTGTGRNFTGYAVMLELPA